MGTPFDLFQGINKGFWAGGAGAPVDTLTLALNALIAGGGYAGHKMGLLNTPPGLIEKPVGGSEWIAEKMRSGGLLNDKPGSTADNFGNVIGGLLGPVTAAKAPQIARGLLQGGQNLAAPRTLNPQTGAIVWHGSPHKFDKFDSSKIGTGEGAQAYGHGLYLAESPGVATSYKTAGLEDNFGSTAEKATEALYAVMDKLGDGRVLYGPTRSAITKDQLLQEVQKSASDVYGSLSPMKQKAADAHGRTEGSLYKVDLPDDAIGRMLNWDKPLNQQNPDVQKILNDKYHWDASQSTEAVSDLLKGLNKNLFQSGNGSPDRATRYLGENGIPGIRYLDAMSREGGGTSNFVVFPGNEGLLSILERNGIPIK